MSAPVSLLLLGLLACLPKSDEDDDDGGGGVDADDDGFVDLAAGGDDCDDSDPAVHPWATELCNEVDDDCDGTVDEAAAADATRWFLDGDGDGYGAPDSGQTACDRPAGSGWVDQGGDCDDADPAFHPGAPEEDCTDPTDYDCDGVTLYQDEDEDGFAHCVDCDDLDPAVNPGAREVCDDVDNDCDGILDDLDPDLDGSGRVPWYPDADGDGYGVGSDPVLACDDPGGRADNALDCDDGNPKVNPGMTELCDDADTDEDCDGLADDRDPDVAVGGYATWYVDGDGDGHGAEGDAGSRSCDPPPGSLDYAATADDCDDADPDVSPSADEVCDVHATDEDCDGLADDLDDDTLTSTMEPWYADGDEDGYGAGSATWACVDPSTATAAFSALSTDCDDGDADVSPAGQELCDAADTDEDCDGDVDDEDASVDPDSAPTWYEDQDGDGYAGEGSTWRRCADPGADWHDEALDCHDDDETVHPGATETCDDVDNDCDPDTHGSGVVWTSSAGVDTDLSATFAAGTAASPFVWTSTAAGTLSFCDGAWSTRLVLHHDVDVIGWGDVTLRGEGLGPVVVVTGATVDASLTDLTLYDGAGYLAGTGSAHDGGSGVRCHDASSLVLDGVVMTMGGTTYAGGMYLEDCDTLAVDTVIHDNDASYYGGGIYILSSDLVMEGCEITANRYPYNGGAISADDGATIELADCVVEGNSASRTGGAFWLDDATLSLVGGSVRDNYANDEEGGGAYLSTSSTGRLTSDGTDWGSGTMDNTPDDISVYYHSGYFVGADGDISCDQYACE
ncbi:right-handed parallel beta-helix repeat-containing protein [Myxococcota bacterium]|nr:right-handed parallel beta-helix repeat-containing protein [Myxococcota bacterium]